MRTFNDIDDYSRECLTIDVDTSLPSVCVIRALPCDNGPGYISQSLVDWANEANDQQITLIYIQLGKPNQNAYIERFNRTARHEWLDLHVFNSIEHAQLLATQWLWQYNGL